MAEHSGSRRSALKTIGWCLLGAAGLWRYLTPRTTLSRAPQISVPLASVPVDGALVLPEHGIALVRDHDDVRGVALACTHLGCTVKATAEGFACPCHGSRFRCDGERIAGPASRPLRRVTVEEQNGTVLVSCDADAIGRA